MTDSLAELPQTARAFLGRIKDLPPNERADRAIKLSGEIVDLIGLVISAHAANRIVSYSDHIASQVGRSYAANALNDLQRSLIEIEILRLVRIWDAPDIDRICIPTAYWLTRDPAVRAILDERNTDILEPYEGYRAEHLARQRGLWRRLDRVMPLVADSDLLKRLRNFRDKRLAHWLTQSKADKTGAIKPAVYGLERRILDRTITVAHVLGMAVRATHFDFKGQREIATHNAKAFWHGCHVTPLE